jgi:outer membrane biosynthesis protein TonB
LFLVVVSGNFRTEGQAGIELAKGVQARHVLFVLTGEESEFKVAGQGNLAGTFFVRRGGADLNGCGSVTGAIYAQDSIQIRGTGVVLEAAAFCPTTQPEPTPTPTETSSPEPSPSVPVTPEPSPTATVTPEPSPSASPSPEPSPSEAPSPEPSPSESPPVIGT